MKWHPQAGASSSRHVLLFPMQFGEKNILCGKSSPIAFQILSIQRQIIPWNHSSITLAAFFTVVDSSEVCGLGKAC